MTTTTFGAAVARAEVQGRRRALDGVRAVAAIGVVVYHCQGRLEFPTRAGAIGAVIGNLGNFGVAVFFLLSGFLLFREFVQWILFDSERVPLPHYFERRFLRIYPAYWLALIGFVIVEGAANVNGDPIGMFTLLGRSTDDQTIFIGLGVAWSLMIEVLFYLALPVFSALVHVVAHRFSAPSARVRVVLVSLALLVVVAHVWIARVVLGPASGPHTQMNLPTFAGWFALGMALAVAVAWRSSGRSIPRWLTDLARRTWACWLLCAVAYAALSFQVSALHQLGHDGHETAAQFQFRIAMQGLAAFFFLLPVVLGGDRSTASRLLGGRQMAWIGVISYGIYLWHPIVIRVVMDRVDVDRGWIGLGGLIAVVGVTSAGIAWLSHRLIERPALRLAR